MSKIPVNVGLDYHQHPVQVVVMDEQGNRLLNSIVPVPTTGNASSNSSNHLELSNVQPSRPAVERPIWRRN